MSAKSNEIIPAAGEFGVFDGVPNEVYQKAPGISNSGLLLVGQAPAIYYGRRLDPNRPPEKDRGGQIEGTLAHCAILEPDEFYERFTVGPTLNRNTKAWKEFAAEAEAAGKTPIQQPQADMAWRQRDSVLAIPDIAEALAQPGRAERSAWWTDPETEELCKVRPDYVAEFDAGDILLDLKTYSSAEPFEFSRQIGRKGYHQQDAMYTEGWHVASGRAVLAFVFVVVETEYPYAASAVVLDEESKQAGYLLFRRNLETYSECRRNQHWPGYCTGIEEVSIPSYLKP